MNRLITILAIIFSFSIISCSDSSGGHTDKGYVDPDLDSAKTLATKSYTLAGYTCSSSKACGAIIYKGELKDVDYVGFAAGKDSANSAFTMKIYWEAKSITSVNLPSSSYTIIVNDGTNEYTSTNDNLNVTISADADAEIYSIIFQSDITVSDGSGNTFTIATGNSVVAYIYDD